MPAPHSPVAVIITAAGESRRMGGVKKEYRPLPGGGPGAGGRPLTVLGASVLVFAGMEEVGTIVITYPEGGTEAALRAALPELPGRPLLVPVPGGKTRRASVQRGLEALRGREPSLVLIHDGARPWVDRDLARRVVEAAAAHGAAIPLVPLTETPKEHDGSGFVTGHPRRERIGAAQTPQGFAWPEILAAHLEAEKREAQGVEYTDDAEVWAAFAGKVAAVPGRTENRKITFPEDMESSP